MKGLFLFVKIRVHSWQGVGLSERLFDTAQESSG